MANTKTTTATATKTSQVQLLEDFEDKDVTLLMAGKEKAVKTAESRRNDMFLNDVNIVKACLIKETEMGEDVESIRLRPIGLSYSRDKSEVTGCRYVMLNGVTGGTIRISHNDFGLFKNENGLDIVSGTVEEARDIYSMHFLADIVITKTTVLHRPDTTIKYPVKYYKDFNPMVEEDGEDVYVSRQPLAWQEWLMDNNFCNIKDGRSWRDAAHVKNKDLPFVTDDKGDMVQTNEQRELCRNMLTDVVFPGGLADRFVEFDPTLSDDDKGDDKEWAFPSVDFTVRVEPYNIKKKRGTKLNTK